MSGRKDYQERKQMKKERYEELAEKARTKSKEYSETHNKIADTIPFGQPILVDHYSCSRHRNDIKKMENCINKSITEDKKANYYDNKVASIDNNSAISSDDPDAISKLQEKLKGLENYKLKVKTRKHKPYELSNLNQQIKSVKDRIKNLQELDEIQFDERNFKGGKVIHNKEINRIQIIFEEIPSEEVRSILKHNSFKWSRYEQAWQRLFNKNSIYAVNRVLEEIEGKI